MNLIEKGILALSPRWAWQRARFRNAAQAAYEAAKPSRLRKTGADNSSGDAVVGVAGPALRGYARQLEQNYDVAEGVLKVLVNNTIGPHGITREPMPRRNDGTIHTEFAKELLELYKDFALRPDVTWEHDMASMERLAARTWFRDGELLAQLLEGRVAGLDHGTRVPFSIELIEADQMPFDYDDESRGITQGVERNNWGRARAFHIYKQHPGDDKFRFDARLKPVPASRMLHPKITNRIKQARGVSVFASVMRRLEDMKDYEESERIAARVAAALTGYIKKGSPDEYKGPEDSEEDRTFSMKPGMVFDRLRVGEEIDTIDSNRPSALLTPFHDAMMRFTAAGVGASNSSLSKNYNGTWSAQRQELVENYGNYQAITSLWINQFSRPVWRHFVNMAIAAGLVRPPSDLDRNTLYDAEFRGPAMPWIDPGKEAAANKMLERSGYKSAQQIIRERGGNPDDTLEQIHSWRLKANENNLVFDTDPAKNSATGAAQDYQREREGIDTTTE